MTLEQAKQHIQDILHAELSDPDDKPALKLAVWAMECLKYVQAVADDVQGYPQSLTELYTWLQHNPMPGEDEPA